MPIPDPNDPTTSKAYVDTEGTVRVEAGIHAPQTAVGVVGFVPNMCLLWKGLAADKPKGWVIEAVPAGSYLKLATADGESGGATGGSATAADHVHVGDDHFHDHSHLMEHVHDIGHDHAMIHAHGMTHNHPDGTTGLENQAPDDVPGGVPTHQAAQNEHDHNFSIADFVGATDDFTGDTDNFIGDSENANPSSTNPDASTVADLGNTGGVVGSPIALTPLFYGLYLIRYTGAP